MPDHCPVHEKQVQEIDGIHVIVAEIATNILWLTRIGKWALGIAGAGILIAISAGAAFNDRLYDVSVSVKASEVRIANLIESHDKGSKPQFDYGDRNTYEEH